MKIVPHVRPTVSSYPENILKYLQISKKKTNNPMTKGTRDEQPCHKILQTANKHEKVLNLISKEKSKLTPQRDIAAKPPEMLKLQRLTMLARIRSKGNSHMLWVGVCWYNYFGNQFGIIY